MGQNRPPDPEHIGDTFLWMKRSPKGPNTFSQTIKNLEPGRLYSFEMLSCDYQDLLHPKQKTLEQANKFVGTVTLDGVDIDPKRSFREMYPSGPEYRMPIPDLDHLSLDDLPRERPDGQADRLRLALRKTAAGTFRPGADLQLSRAATVSRVTDFPSAV